MYNLKSIYFDGNQFFKDNNIEKDCNIDMEPVDFIKFHKKENESYCDISVCNIEFNNVNIKYLYTNKNKYKLNLHETHDLSPNPGGLY